jgi:hypothetical protein
MSDPPLRGLLGFLPTPKVKYLELSGAYTSSVATSSGMFLLVLLLKLRRVVISGIPRCDWLRQREVVVYPRPLLPPAGPLVDRQSRETASGGPWRGLALVWLPTDHDRIHCRSMRPCLRARCMMSCQRPYCRIQPSARSCSMASMVLASCIL